MPSNVLPGQSRDEDIAMQQWHYDYCARLTDGWIAYWQLVQQSVEVGP